MKEKAKKKVEKRQITKNMSFTEIIKEHPESIEVLIGKGMHCIGCPMSQMETLEQGSLAHGLDPDEIVEEINKKIKSKSKNKKG